MCRHAQRQALTLSKLRRQTFTRASGTNAGRELGVTRSEDLPWNEDHPKFHKNTATVNHVWDQKQPLRIYENTVSDLKRIPLEHTPTQL